MIRLFDIVLSGIALLILSPLLLLVMLALRCTGEGEVFYRQQRVGKDGKMFGLLKFATMLKESPNIGTGVLTVKNDPRVLPVGRILRKAKINELPQLVNIFIGDMSVIGRRPLAKKHFDILSPATRSQLVNAKPGLSGIGSIVFRDEENILDHAREKESFYRDTIIPYKGEIELWYLKRQNLGLYFTLIFLTIWVVLFPTSSLHRRLFRDLPRPPLDLVGI